MVLCSYWGLSVVNVEMFTTCEASEFFAAFICGFKSILRLSDCLPGWITVYRQELKRCFPRHQFTFNHQDAQWESSFIYHNRASWTTVHEYLSLLNCWHVGNILQSYWWMKLLWIIMTVTGNRKKIVVHQFKTKLKCVNAWEIEINCSHNI